MARWIILMLALSMGGWMAFDGVRALLVGNYITPKTGARAGQLGPWSHIVSAIGIEPRSSLMKCIFVAYGLAWLAMLASFALGARGAGRAMLVLALASLWYVPLGTVFSIVIILLLLVPAAHASFR
jgi:hypothetical protein